MPLIQRFAALILIIVCFPLQALTLEDLLARPRPAGVVIEIVGPEGSLREGIQQLRELIGQLRGRFPALDIAVVSHGREQFALLAAATEYTDIQGSMRELIAETQIDVHVCGAHAERAGKAPEEFVAFVDVAAHGPEQIRDYEALGFVRLKLRLGP
ncbi:MAG: hypothetical protein AB1450_06440 [Pseudomonadota bacterium]